MSMLGLNETIDQLAMEKQCSFVWSCLKERSHVMKRALKFEVTGQKKKGSLKTKCKEKERRKEERMKVSLSMGDALCRSKWMVGINVIATNLR